MVTYLLIESLLNAGVSRPRKYLCLGSAASNRLSSPSMATAGLDSSDSSSPVKTRSADA